MRYCPDSGKFFRRSKYKPWYEVKPTLSKDGYVQIRWMGKVVEAHRLAYLFMTGEFPKKTVDHKNRVRHDNRWKNLREADMKEQAKNRAKVGSISQLPSGNWRARVGDKTLGTRPTREEAMELICLT